MTAYFQRAVEFLACVTSLPGIGSATGNNSYHGIYTRKLREDMEGAVVHKLAGTEGSTH